MRYFAKEMKAAGGLIFDVCAPGEGGAGEGATPSDESVWRTAYGRV